MPVDCNLKSASKIILQDAGDSPSSLNPKDLVDKDTLMEKSATVEEPNTGTLLNAGDMEDTRLSKGKSMPSLRYKRQNFNFDTTIKIVKY